MSLPDYNEYRDHIMRLHDLTSQARQVAVAMVHEGLPAKNIRKRLYDAMGDLARAAELVDVDLLGQSSTDRAYERDLS